MRERVYPRWVAAGKMKQEKADLEIAVIKAVLETLHDVERLRRIETAARAIYRVCEGLDHVDWSRAPREYWDDLYMALTQKPEA